MSEEFPQVPTVMIPDDAYSPFRALNDVSDLQPRMRPVKLGRIKPKSRPMTLALGFYLPAAPIPLPASISYSEKALSAILRMYVNDQLGCCVISSLLHRLGIYSFNDSDSGGGVLAADDEIRSMYSAWKAGPGDSGCVISDVLDNAKNIGALAGGKRYKIDGYVSVDWRNVDQVKTALYIFGSLCLGVDLPNAWLQAPNGGTWDVTNSQIVGGHDICAVGYNDKGVQICTWGGMRTITWAAFTSNRWITELYVELSPKWYGDDKVSASGIDIATLQADLTKIGGGGIPPIDPIPVPPNPPVPPIPVPPVPPIPVPPEPPAPYVPPVFDVVVTGMFPSGLTGHLVSVTSKGTATPQAPHFHTSMFPFLQTLADVRKLIEDFRNTLTPEEFAAIVADVKAILKDLGVGV